MAETIDNRAYRTGKLTRQDYLPDRTAAAREICCLHSQVYFRLSKESSVFFKIWLTARKPLAS